jgi:hypothetical protein
MVQSMLRDHPEHAKAMMGPLYGMKLLSPSQVGGVTRGCHLVTRPVDARLLGRRV